MFVSFNAHCSNMRQGFPWGNWSAGGGAAAPAYLLWGYEQIRDTL